MTLEQFIEEHRADSMGPEDQLKAKRAAAAFALETIEDGMRLGLGTGSTVECLLQGLSERLKANSLSIVGLPTSKATEQMACELGIPLESGSDFPELSNDLCLDGADRVDSHGNLIKGGGGALLREKMLAYHSRRSVILVDPTKLQSVLTSSFPVPVEVLAFGVQSTMKILAEAAPCEGLPTLRRDQDGRVVLTDNGNCIVDCPYRVIPDPVALELSLKSVPGVIEVGLFCGIMDQLVVGHPNGEVSIWQL